MLTVLSPALSAMTLQLQGVYMDASPTAKRAAITVSHPNSCQHSTAAHAPSLGHAGWAYVHQNAQR
jgi:hypothetical protein